MILMRFFPLGNVPPNFYTSAHGNAPSTSNAFLNNSVNGNALNTSGNGNALNTNGNAPLPPPYFYVLLQIKKLEKLEKDKELEKQKE